MTAEDKENPQKENVLNILKEFNNYVQTLKLSDSTHSIIGTMQYQIYLTFDKTKCAKEVARKAKISFCEKNKENDFLKFSTDNYKHIKNEFKTELDFILCKISDVIDKGKIEKINDKKQEIINSIMKEIFDPFIIICELWKLIDLESNNETSTIYSQIKVQYQLIYNEHCK